MKADDANVMTGTPDRYVQACLSNAVRLDTYIHDATQAGDNELADSFRRAQADSRKGTELGKGLLRSRLTRRAPRTSIYTRRKRGRQNYFGARAHRTHLPPSGHRSE